MPDQTAIDRARELGERPLHDKIVTLTREDCPSFDTIEEFGAWLEAILSQQLDYNTAGAVMAYATYGAFNFAAHRVGATGFQASISALMAYGSIENIEGPFGVVKAHDMLFPQGQTPTESAAEMEEKWREWAAEEAREKIAHYEDEGWTHETAKVDPETGEEIEGETEEVDNVHPNVRAHWEELAKFEPSSKSGEEAGDDSDD